MAKMLTYDELEEAIEDGIDLLNNLQPQHVVCPSCGRTAPEGDEEYCDCVEPTEEEEE